MKKVVTIFLFFLCKTSFTQFGIIQDKDGYANIREKPSINSKIIDTISNGRIIFFTESSELDSNWYLNYAKGIGFIHKSRIKFINTFSKVPIKIKTASLIHLENKIFKITFQKSLFIPKNNKLEFRKSLTDNKELIRINGKKFYGRDLQIPTWRYSKATVHINKSIINLPIDNLFEPLIEFTNAYYDNEKDIIYIIAYNGDGVGSYVVLWIIEKGNFKQLEIEIPF